MPNNQHFHWFLIKCLDASLARYCTSYDSHTYIHWNPAFTATPNSSKFYWFPVKCLQFSCVCVRNWTLFSFTIGISLSRLRKIIHSFTELLLNVCSLDAFWLDIGLYSDISWSIGIPHSRLCQTIHSPKSYLIFRDMFVVSDEFGSDIGLHSHIYIYCIYPVESHFYGFVKQSPVLLISLQMFVV